jgi:hypothetical protein
VSVRCSTGYSAFGLVYGHECLLPAQFAVASWSMVDWENVRNREDLIIARMRQHEQRILEEMQTAEKLVELSKSEESLL